MSEQNETAENSNCPIPVNPGPKYDPVRIFNEVVKLSKRYPAPFHG